MNSKVYFYAKVYIIDDHYSVLAISNNNRADLKISVRETRRGNQEDTGNIGYTRHSANTNKISIPISTK